MRARMALSAVVLTGLLGFAAAEDPASLGAAATAKGAPPLAPAGSAPAVLPAPPAAPLCSIESGVERTAPSSNCLACHTTVSNNFEHGGHRVDVPYEPAGKDLRLKPEERGVNVVLPGGRVTCLTCHDAQSKLPDHLAAPVSGAVEKRLCTACHLFD